MRCLSALTFFLCSWPCWAGGPKVRFTENKGQWPAQVLYRTMLPNGALFVERGGFTYVLQQGGGGHDHATGPGHTHEPYAAHAFRVTFDGGNASSTTTDLTQAHYENFFLGKDPALWGTGCRIHGEVVLHDVWPGIDLRLDGRAGLKYELIVRPGADPAQARFIYEGQTALRLKEGDLIVSTTAGDVREEAPISWSSFFDGVDNKRIPVPSAYRLHGNTLSFDVKADRSLPLTIDPTIAFASYSGSEGNNFGFTATYDAGGHLYGGGIVFSTGYPTTIGVLDDSFNGGTIDVGISKWTPDGTELVWSTYIGGTGNESPHSMVVNDNNELYVFGSTGSSDMPTTPNCFDDSFAGGPPLTFIIGYGYGQPNGTDMFVAHLNSTATSMLGCTYIGGPQNDGLNNDAAVAHNYGDSFRGEIIVDANGDPLVASTTESNDLPVIGGPQSTYGGGSQDGYCFRMDPALSVMQWSTYIGGSGTDAAYGVQVDSNGEFFVTGGTTSNDLPMAGTPFRATFSGATDGFIMRYDGGGALVGSTYLGTSAYDQPYFVQLNTSDEVFVVGQTHGDYPVTPGKYAVAGSSQFIHKLDHSLSTSLWSTRFGNGSADQDLSPTAFLVSDCGQIYFSGWGGSVNGFAGNPNSTTVGLAVTADAYQATTDGSDLYLMLLEPEATGLNYATFFGGGVSEEHVDGGTSRFDKNGTVYQAVCAGCQNNDDFPTTPDAWSNTNNSTGCNLGVMKFDLARGQASIAIDGPSTLCYPATAQFINNSVGGNTFEWDLGNGQTSTEEEPEALYTTEGVFTITLILTDNTGCRGPDTASIVITTLPPPDVIIDPVGPFCVGLSVQLNASGGDSYTWSPATGLDDPTSASPLLTTEVAGTWVVEITTLCGTDRDSVSVDPGEPVGSAGEDQEICLGQSATLNASGGGTYLWNAETTLSNVDIGAPIATPLDSTCYVVQITTPEGCVARDSVVVLVVAGTPEPVLEDTLICIGESIQLVASDGDSHSWTGGSTISDTTVPDPILTPVETTTYVVTITNVCGAIRDTALVEVVVPQADAWPDSTVCPGQPINLFCSDGASYLWNPANLVDDPTVQDPIATVYGNTALSVAVTDEYGCTATAPLLLTTFPEPFIDAGMDRVIEFGDHVQLNATGNGTFQWQPAFTLSADSVQSPVAYTLESTTYTVTITDANGCTATDMVTVILPGTLFVPNTFTPNGDGYNDFFGAWGKDLATMELLVYNRWGELIWTTENLNGRWDGTYNGHDSPIDTYVWKVKATDVAGKQHDSIGHVNLLR